MNKKEGKVEMLTTHSACNVVWRFNDRHEIEFLVHDYSSEDPDTGMYTQPEVRFPTGTSGSGELGETTEETSVRKLEEETGLVALDTEQIAKMAGNHPKHVFLIDFNDCLGELHPGPIDIRGDRMSAPYWVSVRELRTRISPKHFWIYRAAAEKLRALVLAV